MAKFAIPSFFLPNSKNEIVISEIGFHIDNRKEAQHAADLSIEISKAAGVKLTGRTYYLDPETGTGDLKKDGYIDIWPETPLGKLHIILISGPLYDMLESKSGQYEKVLQIRPNNPNYHDGNLTIH